MSYSPLFKSHNGLCQFSKHGTYIAYSYLNTLVVRDCASQQIVQNISLIDSIDKIQWSYDSKLLLCAFFKRRTVQIISMDNKDWMCKIQEGDAGIIDACWTPDSRHVLTIAECKIWICIWSLIDACVRYIHNPKCIATDLISINEEGSLLAVIKQRIDKDVIAVFHTSTWKIGKTVECSELFNVGGLRWSPDNDSMCIWESRIDKCHVKIFSAKTGVLIGEFENSDDFGPIGVTSVTWSPTSQFLAVGCYNRKVVVLNTITWKPFAEFTHSYLVSSTGCKIFREMPKGINRNKYTDLSSEFAFDEMVERPVSITDINEDKRGIIQAIFSSCGRYFVTSEESIPAVAWIWDMLRLELHCIIVTNHKITDFSWNPIHPHLIISSDSSRVCLWTGSNPRTLEIPTSDSGNVKVLKAVWHNTGCYVALCGNRNFVVLTIP